MIDVSINIDMIYAVKSFNLFVASSGQETQ